MSEQEILDMAEDLGYRMETSIREIGKDATDAKFFSEGLKISMIALDFKVPPEKFKEAVERGKARAKEPKHFWSNIWK